MATTARGWSFATTERTERGLSWMWHQVPAWDEVN